MKLVKNDTFWNDPFADWDWFLNRTFSSPSSWLRGFGEAQQAFRVDAYHDEDRYYVVAELPGFAKEDVKLELENSVLTIEANRKVGEGDKARTYSYTRSITVGDDVDAEKVGAKLENGLLTITLPKSEQRKPRPIAIA